MADPLSRVRLPKWEKFQPVGDAGEPYSDRTPVITRPSVVEQAMAGQRADTELQILVELRVISRLLAAGLNVGDDLDLLRNDERAGAGQ